MRTEPAQGQTIIPVASANSPECVEKIAKIQPGVVLLAGCRMLSRDMLAKIPCPVLNYHAGIAPKYRGMNGGYWALASGDAQNFGTTVHLVDAGVDTGAVLRQARGNAAAGRHDFKLRACARPRFRGPSASRRWRCAGRKTRQLRSGICRRSNGTIRRSGPISGPDFGAASGRNLRYRPFLFATRRSVAFECARVVP